MPPDEDEFDDFICHGCVSSNPFLFSYADSELVTFLPQSSTNLTQNNGKRKRESETESDNIIIDNESQRKALRVEDSGFTLEQPKARVDNNGVQQQPQQLEQDVVAPNLTTCQAHGKEGT
jgi:hypothetical protein